MFDHLNGTILVLYLVFRAALQQALQSTGEIIFASLFVKLFKECWVYFEPDLPPSSWTNHSSHLTLSHTQSLAVNKSFSVCSTNPSLIVMTQRNGDQTPSWWKHFLSGRPLQELIKEALLPGSCSSCINTLTCVRFWRDQSCFDFFYIFILNNHVLQMICNNLQK